MSGGKLYGQFGRSQSIILINQSIILIDGRLLSNVGGNSCASNDNLGEPGWFYYCLQMSGTQGGPGVMSRLSDASTYVDKVERFSLTFQTPSR